MCCSSALKGASWGGVGPSGRVQREVFGTRAETSEQTKELLEK